MTNDITVANPVFAQVQGYDYRQPERVFFNPFNPSEIWVSSFGNGMRMGNLTVTGTHDVASENALEVYPNPATEVVTLESETAGEVCFYDLEGRLLRTYIVIIGENKLSVRDLAAGVYVVRLNGRVGKLVKE